MKKTIFTIVLLLAVTIMSHAQTDDTYSKTLKTMLEISGSQETFKLVLNQVTNMFKQQKPDIPESTWDEINKEMSQTALDDLIITLAPIYQKHLTLGDLQGVIDFYKTPDGKKFADKTPIISQESMQAGQQWGMKLSSMIQEKIALKGY